MVTTFESADTMANDLYEFVAKGVRDRGIAIGMQYFLIVISNKSIKHGMGKPDRRLTRRAIIVRT